MSEITFGAPGIESFSTRHIGMIGAGKPKDFEKAVAAVLRKDGNDVAFGGSYAEADGSIKDIVNACGKLIFIGPMQTHIREIAALCEMAKTVEIPPIVFWFTEQIPNPNLPTGLSKTIGQFRYGISVPLPGYRFRAVGELLNLKRIAPNLVIHTFSDTNTDYLSKLGLQVYTTPWGYHSKMGELRQTDFFKRDIDVVFLGSTSDKRRGPIVKKIAAQLKIMGIKIEVTDAQKPVFGEKRTTLLNRAKIMLCIAREPWDDHVYRMLLGGANGVLNITETNSSSQGPFVANEDFATEGIKRLPELIAYFLKNPDLMSQMAMNGHKKATGSTLEQQVNQLFSKSNQNNQ